MAKLGCWGQIMEGAADTAKSFLILAALGGQAEAGVVGTAGRHAGKQKEAATLETKAACTAASPS